VFDTQIGSKILFGDFAGTKCQDLLKSGHQMAGSKDHTDISVYNILRPAIRSLSADEQQLSDDLMSQLREEARRQIAKDEEEETKKFLSYVMVDRHQKITKHGEIEIAYLLPALRISNVSKSDDIQFF
jgi:L-2-hydroxyglutarate oxidase LhgO